ncbi:hypothetical protein HS961_00825 [Comamonas piscis]|uniref:Uncharacterized protein n=1 Tax=Comamonas piscis TaxID=1562974 RepID=A0A7G5EBW6_9BURK|nr:hypothetical protein [Comamonas piscis]QMV71491.1 hypothetical protein HS961_00825 [Comamonas piscis]WSO34203.1 hypothetical protein VUJ63_00825 [Comamonas piscis]
MITDRHMEQQRQQWRQAQQQLTRSQLRSLRDQWLERGSQLPLQANARRLMWLRLRCSLLLAQQRF